jgi:hypothetical protein
MTLEEFSSIMFELYDEGKLFIPQEQTIEEWIHEAYINR